MKAHIMDLDNSLDRSYREQSVISGMSMEDMEAAETLNSLHKGNSRYSHSTVRASANIRRKNSTRRRVLRYYQRMSRRPRLTQKTNLNLCFLSLLRSTRLLAL